MAAAREHEDPLGGEEEETEWGKVEACQFHNLYSLLTKRGRSSCGPERDYLTISILTRLNFLFMFDLETDAQLQKTKFSRQPKSHLSAMEKKMSGSNDILQSLPLLVFEYEEHVSCDRMLMFSLLKQSIIVNMPDIMAAKDNAYFSTTQGWLLFIGEISSRGVVVASRHR
jgi:hypothetical protein